MEKYWGEAAEARLEEAWEPILGEDPHRQEIIHVQCPMTVEPEWVAGFETFRAWVRNGREASEGVWRSFFRIADTWPYVVNARLATAAGIPNIRTLILPTGRPESFPVWLQYLSTVHLPAIAAMCGEQFYLISSDDCRRHGIPVRDHDVNLFGAAGVMMAGGENGDVEWRIFLDEAQDGNLFHKEIDFLFSVRDFAIENCQPFQLPAVIRLSK